MVGGIENEGESMPRTRKSHPPSLKARVAVEAIKRHRTTAQIAQMFGVHPDPGRRLEETGVGRFARRLRQRPRADAPTGRRRKGRSLQADRPNESGAGLFKKKELALAIENRRLWIDPQHPRLSVQQQCELLGLALSSYYYQPRPESAENLRLLRRLDELYLECPFFGSRRMAITLEVNRKRIQRLMRIAGIEALYPKPNLSRPAPGHEIYPYLLRGVSIERPNQVWSTDITYIPMHGGFLYLVAVMDWFSRFVLSWELSNTMETGFCLAALDAAFRFGQPEIWNSDQGSQFTSPDFLAPLKKRGISISMDGRGRALDNIFIERLWRSLKYELIYPGDFASGLDLFPALDRYFHFYNYQRPHQALGYCSPAEMFPLRSKRTRPSP